MLDAPQKKPHPLLVDHGFHEQSFNLLKPPFDAFKLARMPGHGQLTVMVPPVEAWKVCGWPPVPVSVSVIGAPIAVPVVSRS